MFVFCLEKVQVQPGIELALMFSFLPPLFHFTKRVARAVNGPVRDQVPTLREEA